MGYPMEDWTKRCERAAALRASEARGGAGRLLAEAGGHSAIEDLAELRPAARSALARALSGFVNEGGR